MDGWNYKGAWKNKLNFSKIVTKKNSKWHICRSANRLSHQFHRVFLTSTCQGKNYSWINKVILVKSNVDVEIKRNAVLQAIDGLQSMGANFSPKMHLFSHFNKLVECQQSVTDQHDEKVHQTMKDFEYCYEEKTSIAMICDYFWMHCLK